LRDRVVSTSKTSPPNIPSLEEAERVVVRFILRRGGADRRQGRRRLAAGGQLAGVSRAHDRGVGAAEQLYRAIGQPYPAQWESLERSAQTFMDHFVVAWLAEGDPVGPDGISQRWHPGCIRRRSPTSLDFHGLELT